MNFFAEMLFVPRSIIVGSEVREDESFNEVHPDLVPGSLTPQLLNGQLPSE